MKVSVKNNAIVIELPFDKNGTPSKSGKSVVHATTSGNTAVGLPDGSQLSVGVNVFSKNPDFKPDKKK